MLMLDTDHTHVYKCVCSVSNIVPHALCARARAHMQSYSCQMWICRSLDARWWEGFLFVVFVCWAVTVTQQFTNTQSPHSFWPTLPHLSSSQLNLFMELFYDEQFRKSFRPVKIFWCLLLKHLLHCASFTSFSLLVFKYPKQLFYRVYCHF